MGAGISQDAVRAFTVLLSGKIDTGRYEAYAWSVCPFPLAGEGQDGVG